MGSVACYAALNALTVVVPLLVLWFVSVFLRVRVKWPAVVFCFAMVFADASAFELGKYLGLLSNLCSHFFGTCSLLLFLRAATGERSSLKWAGLAFFFFPRSVRKISCFRLESWLRYCSSSRSALTPRELGTMFAGRALLIVGLVVGAAVTYNLLRSSPFLAGVSGAPVSSGAAYAVDANPAHLAGIFYRLTATYLPLAICGFAFAWVLAPAQRLRLAGLAVMIGSLVLPYALIPNHSPGYRAFAWLPWLAAMAAIGVQLVNDRICARNWRFGVLGGACALVLSAASVYWLWQPRMIIAGWYGQVQAMNSRVGRSLVLNRATILAAPQVAVIGVEGLSPWSNNNGEYLKRRLGFKGVWVVFVNANSSLFQLDPPGLRAEELPPTDRISVQPLSKLCEWPDIPALTYDSNGTGVLGSTAASCKSMRNRNASH